MNESPHKVIHTTAEGASLQRLLFILSFLMYGLGDGVTAFYMMDQSGVVRESNHLMQFMYISNGWQGVIGIKIWFTFMILLFVWLISSGKNTYWSVNGFLFALSLGGIMAMRSNMMVINGVIPPSPGSVIITYLLLTLLFVMIGSLLDKLSQPRPHSHKNT